MNRSTQSNSRGSETNIRKSQMLIQRAKEIEGSYQPTINLVSKNKYAEQDDNLSNYELYKQGSRPKLMQYQHSRSISVVDPSRKGYHPAYMMDHKIMHVPTRPLFKMPEFHHISLTDTPGVGVENTTAKKQLDFESTDLQLNQRRLRIDALSEQQCDDDVHQGYKEHSEFNSERRPQDDMEEEFVGAHYVQHYDDQDDEHIVIDLEQEQTESNQHHQSHMNHVTSIEHQRSAAIEEVKETNEEESYPTDSYLPEQVPIMERQPLIERRMQSNLSVYPQQFNQSCLSEVSALCNPVFLKTIHHTGVKETQTKAMRNLEIQMEQQRLLNRLFNGENAVLSQSQFDDQPISHQHMQFPYTTLIFLIAQFMQVSGMTQMKQSSLSMASGYTQNNQHQVQMTQPRSKRDAQSAGKPIKRVLSNNSSNSRSNATSQKNLSLQKTGPKHNQHDYRTVNSTISKYDSHNFQMERPIIESSAISQFSVAPPKSMYQQLILQHPQDDQQQYNYYQQAPILSQATQRTSNDSANLHQLRLKNAEQRVIVSKLQKKLAEQNVYIDNITKDNQRLNKLRESDLQLFKNQEMHIRNAIVENSDLNRSLACKPFTFLNLYFQNLKSRSEVCRESQNGQQKLRSNMKRQLSSFYKKMTSRIEQYQANYLLPSQQVQLRYA